jgi:hypothetical protein
MASERQFKANQQNAQKSTGPRTDAGRARSSMNAIIHGLTAMRCLLPGEDAEALEKIRQDLYEEYGVHGAIGIALVEQMAWLIWRSNRVQTYERELIAWGRTIMEVRDLHISREQKLHLPQDVDLYPLGRILETMFEKDSFSKLNRYVGSLQKQLLQTREVLEKMKSKPCRMPGV